MAVLPVIKFLDSRLKMKSKPVTRFDDSIRAVVRDMRDTYHSIPSVVGLAAPQLGVAKRIVLVCVERGTAPVCLVNPEIVERSETQRIRTESCLSIPALSLPVRRSENIRVSYQDIHGNSRTMNLSGFAAACAQHEIDHLDGILIVDRFFELPQQELSALHKLDLRTKLLLNRVSASPKAQEWLI